MYIEVKTCNEKQSTAITNLTGRILARWLRILPSDSLYQINPLLFNPNQNLRQRNSSSPPSHDVASIKDSKNDCSTRREVIQSINISQLTDAVRHADLLAMTGSQRAVTMRLISNYEWLLPVTSSLPTGTPLPISSMAAHWLC